MQESHATAHRREGSDAETQRTTTLFRPQELTLGLSRIKAGWGGPVTLRRARREPWIARRAPF
jgi:hypothetical protein